MAILRVRDNEGNVTEIPAIKGDKGDKGSPGSGVLVGTYVGDGKDSRTIEFDGYLNAILILNQKVEPDVSNDGFSIRGGFVPNTGGLSDGQNVIAYINIDLVGENKYISYLHLNNAAYNVGMVEGGYANGLNFNGTTYHYIAFMG